MVEKGFTIENRLTGRARSRFLISIAEGNFLRRVTVGLIDFKLVSGCSVVAKIAYVIISVRVFCYIFPVHIFCIRNRFCRRQLARKVEFVQFRLAATVIVRDEQAGGRAICKPRTFRGNGGKLAYFANFVVRTHLLEIIDLMIRLASAEHRFDSKPQIH